MSATYAFSCASLANACTASDHRLLEIMVGPGPSTRVAPGASPHHGRVVTMNGACTTVTSGPQWTRKTQAASTSSRLLVALDVVKDSPTGSKVNTAPGPPGAFPTILIRTRCTVTTVGTASA